MQISRRDLSVLLTAVAARATAQTKPAAMPTKIFHSDQIAYEGDDKKKGRRFFAGATHTGFHLEVHETILGPGTPTHAPHKHEHEEIIFLASGTLEAFMDGKTERVEAGSTLYFGSNGMHNVRNIGTTPARYFVVELRGAEAA